MAAIGALAGCKLIIGYEDPIVTTVTTTGIGGAAGSTGTGGAGTGGSVAVDPCMDGAKNGDETGTDCGGPCGACPLGEGCKAGPDCESKSCGAGGVCVASICDDKATNGDETDADCGGKTCGPCAFGKGCAQSADCVTGFCNGTTCDAETIVGGLTNPNSLAVDSENVYWADADDGAVMMADVATGTPMPIVTGLQDPQRLVGGGGPFTAAEATSVYWVEPSAGKVVSAYVSPLSGAQVQPPATGGHPHAVVSDGSYWTNQAAPAEVPQGSIMTRDLASPTSSYVFIALDGQPDRLVLGGTTKTDFVFDMDVYGVRGLWTVPAKMTSTPKLLVQDVDVAGIAADANFAYWSDGKSSGVVARVPLAGGIPAVLASQQAKPADIVVDALYAYWLNQGTSPTTGAIMQAPLSGGSPVVLASGQEAPRGLYLFGSDLYWLSGAKGQGAVRRVRK